MMALPIFVTLLELLAKDRFLQMDEVSRRANNASICIVDNGAIGNVPFRAIRLSASKNLYIPASQGQR